MYRRYILAPNRDIKEKNRFCLITAGFSKMAMHTYAHQGRDFVYYNRGPVYIIIKNIDS